MSDNNNAEIRDIAEAIKRYLKTRPNASETVEGVAKWWLSRQRYDDSIEQVQNALDFLVETGILVKRRLNDGIVIYTSTN